MRYPLGVCSPEDLAMKRAVRFQLPEQVQVEGLGIGSGEAVWLGRPAAESLLGAARRAGLGGEGEDAVSLSAGAVATAATLRAFARRCQASEGDVVGSLSGVLGRWSEEAALGPPARLRYLRGGGQWSEAREQAAERVVLEGQARELPVPLADRPAGRRVALPWSELGLWSTDHWAGVLWANLLAMGPWMVGVLLGPRWLAPLRVLWGIARTRSLRPEVVAGGLNRLGRGAWVHPSAVVEGCVLGAGAVVDAGAVVRGSVLGEGARVEPAALVLGSVLGAGAVVQRHAWAQFSVLHQGAAHGGAMQLGVLGPEASVKGGAYLLDQGASRGVRASRGGALYAAPLGLLGVGVGRGALVASGVWVAPGRTVPPGAVLLPRPGLVLRPEDQA
ncbi:MAG: hypothetical protein JXX28_06665 [Deltaproteobacteria bacterium]|nr:hypothetical protein [Deltaproteobacteria bacterium]